MEIEINKIKDIESIWIISISLKLKMPETFVIFFTGDKDVPYLKDDKIALFSRREILTILNNFHNNKLIDSQVQENIDFNYNIPQLINAIKTCDPSFGGYILDCINLLMDAIDSIKVNIPDFYHRCIKDLADFLTFNPDLSLFIKEGNTTIEELLNSISWFHGILLNNSVYNIK